VALGRLNPFLTGSRLSTRMEPLPLFGCGFDKELTERSRALMPLPQPLFEVFPVDDPEYQDHLVGVIDLINESIVTDAHAKERIFAALDCLD